MNSRQDQICSTLQPHLVEYVHGEAQMVGPAIERHLEDCPKCTALLRDCRDLRTLAADSIPPARYALQFKMDEVLQEAARSAERGKSKGRFRRAKMWAAAVAGLGLGASLLPTTESVVDALRSLTPSQLLLAYLAVVVVLMAATPIFLTGRSR